MDVIVAGSQTGLCPEVSRKSPGRLPEDFRGTFLAKLEQPDPSKIRAHFASRLIISSIDPKPMRDINPMLQIFRYILRIFCL